MASRRAIFWSYALGSPLGLFVVASIWLPVLRHYYVPTPRIDDDLLASAKARPTDDVLADIAQTDFLSFKPKVDEDTLRAADALLRGTLTLAGEPPVRIGIPFAAADLGLPYGKVQLALAGLVVPDTLLAAYEITHDEKYFEAATAALVAFAEHERGSYLPTGTQWNDHAVAMGVQVLGEFWHVYRRHPAYRDDVARTIIAFAARSGEILEKDSQFTFATNHGVMQNLALLHLALAFPDLPGTDRRVRLAVERLDAQLRFYVSTEGVVLEHSFGYHTSGTNLLGSAIRYLEMLAVDVPQIWRDKYAAAVRFDERIRRPDGSLPRVGDTGGYEALHRDWLGLPALPASTGGLLATYPVSGYGILWSPGAPGLSPSQAVVTWSNFDGHGHKHADELSVDLWAAGRDWWSNLGYWPYDDLQRPLAVSWLGSSAPHKVGEGVAALKVGAVGSTFRKSRLLASGAGRDVAALDAQRETGAGYSTRRQLVQVGTRIWIVIDQHLGAGDAGGRVLWTAALGLALRPGADHCYALEPSDAPERLTSCFFAPESTEFRVLRASTEPFAGWQLVDDGIVPSSALLIDGKGDAPWLVSVWVLSDSAEESRAVVAELESWAGPEHWSVGVSHAGAVHTIARADATISVRASTAAANETVVLEPPTDSTAAIAAIEQAFLATEREYPVFQSFLRYRYTATMYLLLAWLAQELVLAVLLLARRDVIVPLRIASVTVWIAGAYWLHFHYFA